jgi:transcriptional regulator with XRE-family HTH domain
MPREARSSDIKADVGRRLKAARSIVFDTSNACAKALGIHVNTWRGFESGEKYPDPAHLVRFCEATGFTTDFIYRGRFKGIAEDVQIRLAAEYPELVDEAPDVGHPAKVAVPV